MSARHRIRLVTTTVVAILWAFAGAAIALAGDGAGPLPK
jgi:hypothetical protein